MNMNILDYFSIVNVFNVNTINGFWKFATKKGLRGNALILQFSTAKDAPLYHM